MIPDPTDEMRAIRNRLAAKCNYDLDRIVEETRQHQRDSGRTYCSLDQGPRAEGDEKGSELFVARTLLSRNE